MHCINRTMLSIARQHVFFTVQRFHFCNSNASCTIMEDLSFQNQNIINVLCCLGHNEVSGINSTP